jgi:hypothetical protein
MKRLKHLRWILPVMLFLAVPSCLAYWKWNMGRTHQHCIKVSGSVLSSYARDHQGRFPSHTNGFGDALALLVAEGYDDGRHLVGVDDDASWLRAAATNHTDVPEELCTRIYVQGLTENNNQGIAILFDRYAVRGGDHFRGIRRLPYLREVCLLDGSMQTVSLRGWPTFASNQIELLVQEGIPRKTAEAYYRPTLDPQAKR